MEISEERMERLWNLTKQMSMHIGASRGTLPAERRLKGLQEAISEDVNELEKLYIEVNVENKYKVKL